MFDKLIENCKKVGMFDNYPEEHIVVPYLSGNKIPLEYRNDEISVGVIIEYDTFMSNFIKTIAFIKKKFDQETFEWIIREYLACSKTYSDKEFFLRYSNILVICKIMTTNIDVENCEIFRAADMDIFQIAYKNGKSIRFYTGVLDRGNTRNIFYQSNMIELGVGLKREDVEKFKNKVCSQNAHLNNTGIENIVYELSKVNVLEDDENAYNICLLHLITENVDGFNNFSTKGVLLNHHTGLFVNDILHEEYGLNNEIVSKISGVLSIQYSLHFLLYGDANFLLDESHYFFAVNELKSNSIDNIYPFIRTAKTEKNMRIYNWMKDFDYDIANAYLIMLIQEYIPANSAVFTNKEFLFIEAFIQKTLLEIPQLLIAFGTDINIATKEILAKYEIMYTVIQKKYPSNHPFKNKKFLFDATAFSLAYCMYVVPTFLKNTFIMDDFLHKKFVCKTNERFDKKVFNESYSEFEIFFYLYVSIFCYSYKYEKYIELEYEPDGNQNKRFEYSFVFTDCRVNIEVKALECAPEFADKIDLIKMKDGAKFYKNYFHANEKESIIPYNVIETATELKSNYRQVSKNIKRINQKCIEADGVINLGFLMINYGTSREEFLSYLLNHNHGYLHKNPLDKLDALILFSMCIDTDLMMNKILEDEHIFVFCNERKDNIKLLTELRLCNFVFDLDENYYSKFIDEVYGEYIGIKSDGLLTIQRSNVLESEVNQAKKYVNHKDRVVRDLFEYLE